MQVEVHTQVIRHGLLKATREKHHEIVFYNSAESLPIRRYQRFNKFVMIDAEVGNTFEDYNLRSMNAIEFLKKGMKDDAVRELENRRQMVFNTFMEYTPKGRALAILIFSINGEVFTDYSSDGLDLVIDKLEEIGYSQKSVEEGVDSIRKK